MAGDVDDVIRAYEDDNVALQANTTRYGDTR